MLNRTLVFAAVIVFTATAVEHAPAVWRGAAARACGPLDPETRDWVKTLKNKFDSSCCDTADGFAVEVDGWDMAGTVDDTSGMGQWEAGNARSGYRVRLRDGKWHDVPNFAVIDPKTNRLGYAVVTARSFIAFFPEQGAEDKVARLGVRAKAGRVLSFVR